MSLVAVDDEKGQPRWWCTTCDTKTARDTFMTCLGNTLTRVGDWWQDSLRHDAFVFLLIVLGATTLVLGVSIPVTQENARVAAVRHKQEQQWIVVDNYAVFYNRDTSTCDSFLKAVKREALHRGDPCQIYLADRINGVIYLRTSRAAIYAAKSAATDLVFDGDRLATKEEMSNLRTTK